MKNKYVAAALFCCIFIVAFVLIQHLVVNTVSHFRVEGYFPYGAKVHVDTSNGIHPINSFKRYSKNIEPFDKTQLFEISFDDATVTSFSISVEDNSSDSKLFTIAIFSYFNPPIVFTHGQFPTVFKVSNNHSGKTIYTLKTPLEYKNWLLSFTAALLFSGCLLMLVSKVQWQQFPAIQDFIATQNSANQNNFASLDGLRGFAALLVFLQHSTGFFHGVGDFGVWLFFVLSGFLLTKPFVLDHSYAIHKEKMLSFLARRIKRIVPLFFFVITIIFLVQGDHGKAFRHYIFVQGDGHFWTILQEMYFYLMLPIIGVIIYSLCKRNNLAAIVALFTASLLWANFGTVEVFSIYGFHHNMRGYFEVFIIGMIGAYFYFGIFLPSPEFQRFFSNYKNALSALGITLLLSMIFISMLISEKILGFDFHLKNHSIITALVCLILILLAITTRNSWYNRLLKNPFLRYVGIIGYSFYLVHPYAIFICRDIIRYELLLPHGNFIWLLASMSLIITIIFASFTYAYIERPFLHKRSAFQNERDAKLQQTS